MILYLALGIIGTLILLITAFVNLSPQFGAKPSGKRLERIEQSKNYRDGKFVNLSTVKDEFGFGDYMKFLPKLIKGSPNSAPNWSIPVRKRTREEASKNIDSATTITWFGHSAILLRIDGYNLLIDPMFGNVPAPASFLGGSRFNDTLPIVVPDLPYIDAVLISHDHYDHLDYGSIVQLKDNVGHFYVPLGVGAHLEQWGVSEDKITELDWWEEVTFKSLTFVATPAQHFSGRALSDKMKTLWMSWVIKGKKHKIYFSGDSGYFEGFREIGENYGPFDMSMIECGQYNELWTDIHIFPEKTAQAHIDLRGKVLMPIHWGAFALSTLHDWDEPVRRLSKKAAALNITLTTPMIGEEIFLDASYPNRTWWNNDKSTKEE